MPEFRYMDWAEFGNLADALAEKVKVSGVKFDVIIGIARGGIPVAMVVSDHLAVSIDFINVKSYTGIAERADPQILSTLTERIVGKNVLVVDDLVDQGDTLRTVAAFLAEKKPKTLMTAVLFKKPWTKTNPDFYLAVEDKWVDFPWEHGEVSRMRKANGEVLHGRA